MMNDHDSASSLLLHLAEEFAARCRRGERPSVQEYIDKHPDLAEHIRDTFPAMMVMEKFGSMAGPPTGSYADGVRFTGPMPERLGEYRILREVARGGMGVVYEAVQESLGRHVALKVLPTPVQASSTHLKRFQSEARAAAKLHHTNIVPVFGVGEHEGVHFYAMQFIRGQGLDTVIAELRRLRQTPAAEKKSGSKPPATPAAPPENESIAQGLITGRFSAPKVAPPADSAATKANAISTTGILQQKSDTRYYRSVAQVGVQVAEALAHAHQQGVLHRDIKPGNLLLDDLGSVWITDFGLAKSEGSAEITSQGDIVGTLRYMAPERFAGKSDGRSDIYSLGLTLYELLTLQPAFDATDKAKLIDLMLHQPNPQPRKIDSHIPRDLEIIVLKVMAKAPEDRYDTAQEVADDLRRFLDDKPIHARRPNLVQRFRKWARRHRAAVTTALVGLVVAGALLAGAIGRSLSQRAAALAVTTAEVEKDLAESVEHQKHGRIPKAIEATNQALAALASGTPDEELRKRVKDRRRDLQMIADIEDARLAIYAASTELAEPVDLTRMDAIYQRLFEKFELKVEGMEPEKAAEAIKARSVSVELAAALGDWAMARRIIWNKGGQRDTPDSWKHLLAVARAADPDPTRNRIRDTLAELEEKALNDLLTKLAPEDLPVPTILLLVEVVGITDAKSPALDLFRAAQRLHPDNFWINHHLAIALFNAEPPQWEDVVRFYSVALACRPEHPVVWLELGNALSERGKLKEAEAAYRRAIQYKPDFGIAHYCLGNTHRDLGDLDAARDCFLKAIECNSKDHEALQNLGNIHVRRKQWDKAVPCYRAALEHNPGDHWLQIVLGQSLLQSGDLLEAEKTIQDMIDKKARFAEVYYVLGRVEEARLDWAAAEKQFWLATKAKFLPLRPRSRKLHSIELSDIQLHLSKALLEQGKVVDAGKVHRDFLSLKKDDAQALCELGAVYHKHGLWKEAHAAYAAAVAAKHEHAEAHFGIGASLVMLGEHGEAIPHFQEAIKLKRDYGEAHFNLGLLLERKGDLDVAADHLQTAIGLMPKHAKAHFQLGVTQYRRNKLPEAEEALRQAVALDPTDGIALYSLGLVISDRGREEEAEEWYRKAIQAQADVAEAHCNLAHILRRRGEFAEALTWFRSGHDYGMKIPKDGGLRKGGWHYPSERWVKDCELLVEMDRKAVDALGGRLETKDATELFKLGAFCRLDKGHVVAAAKLYARGLEMDIQPPPELRGTDLLNAALAAAEAAGGKGRDALKLTEVERDHWSKQALQWLHAAHAHWAKRLEEGTPAEKAVIVKLLGFWQRNPELALVRDREGPAAQALWADVGVLLKKSNMAAEAAATLTVGSPVKGMLEGTDPTDSFPLTQKSHRKVHEVRLEAGQPYLIDLRGDFDVFLRVEDSKSKPLLFNDDVRPDDFSSRLVFVPTKGDTYRLIVTSFKPGDAGAYHLSVEKAVKVGEPMVLEDKLVDTKPKAPERFFKRHKINLVGGGAYTIELESTAFDTFLVLLDDLGKNALADNDDVSPDNTRMSRLDFTPKSDGTFTLHVTSFKPGETGPYRLKVQRYQSIHDKIATPGKTPDMPAMEVAAAYDLGNKLRRAGQYARAAEAYEKARRIDPNFPRTYANLGAILIDQGKFDEAEKVLREGQARQKGVPEIVINLAIILDRRARYDEALALLKEGKALLPKDAKTHRDFDELLKLYGKFADIQAKLPDLISGKLTPPGVPERLMIAEVCIANQAYAAAVRFYEEAFAQDPAAANHLGNAHRYDAARAAACAGCGLDKALTSEGEQALMRGKSRAWLRADLLLWKSYGERFGSNPSLLQMLERWRQHVHFAGVRDAASLATLAGTERIKWRIFWAEVDALHARFTMP